MIKEKSLSNRIIYHDKKVSKIISSIYIKKDFKTNIVYTFNKEIEVKAKEIANILLCFSSKEDKEYLYKKNIPLFELEVIYKIVDEKIVKYVNFINLRPQVNNNEELFKLLQTLLMQIQLIVDKSDKITRNELCPCKSGKKYKNCHGE